MNFVPTSPEEAVANRERLLRLLNFNESDRGEAETLAFLYGLDLRFDYSGRMWRYWNSRFWAPDQTGAAERASVEAARLRFMAAQFIPDLDARKKSARWAIHLESAGGVRDTLKSAETTPPFPTTAADYDRDPYLLTTGNCTLELRTGEPRECRPEDLITRATDVLYFPDATCPAWDKFLQEIFDGNIELIKLVQRAVGYSLTGITTENVLFILYGGG